MNLFTKILLPSEDMRYFETTNYKTLRHIIMFDNSSIQIRHKLILGTCKITNCRFSVGTSIPDNKYLIYIYII